MKEKAPGVKEKVYDFQETPSYIAFWTRHPEDKNKRLVYFGFKEMGRVTDYLISEEDKPNYIKYWYLPYLLMLLWLLVGIGSIAVPIILL